MNTCKSCRWRSNCHHAKVIRKWQDESYELPYDQDPNMPVCRDFERVDGKRNTEATCRNCPYSSEESLPDSIACGYDQYYVIQIAARPACRHHPRFWKED